MKKIIVLFICLSLFLILSGCIKVFNFTELPSKILINKNVNLTENCSANKFKTLVITDKQEITKLFSNLNKMQYKYIEFTNSICMYEYEIMWNIADGSGFYLQIINNQYFKPNDGSFKVAKLTEGSFAFLNEYEFEIDE